MEFHCRVNRREILKNPREERDVRVGRGGGRSEPAPCGWNNRPRRGRAWISDTPGDFYSAFVARNKTSSALSSARRTDTIRHRSIPSRRALLVSPARDVSFRRGLDGIFVWKYGDTGNRWPSPCEDADGIARAPHQLSRACPRDAGAVANGCVRVCT